MNLGQAVAVCLYELVRNPKVVPGAAKRSEKQALATAGEVERVTTMLFDLLSASAYMSPSRAPSTAEKVRRLVRRLKLSAPDAELWLGILRQIAWKLRSGTR
jgi:tRNA C32,U32 (ribose-2'-O)-methylase TrmJ